MVSHILWWMRYGFYPVAINTILFGMAGRTAVQPGTHLAVIMQPFFLIFMVVRQHIFL